MGLTPVLPNMTAQLGSRSAWVPAKHLLPHVPLRLARPLATSLTLILGSPGWSAEGWAAKGYRQQRRLHEPALPLPAAFRTCAGPAGAHGTSPRHEAIPVGASHSPPAPHAAAMSVTCATQLLTLPSMQQAFPTPSQTQAITKPSGTGAACHRCAAGCKHSSSGGWHSAPCRGQPGLAG